MKSYVDYLEQAITKTFLTSVKTVKAISTKVCSAPNIFKPYRQQLHTVAIMALTVYISVAINAFYRPIQEWIHEGIIWTYNKSETLGDFVYEANAVLLNGKDFDRERSSKKVIYTAYSQVVMVNVLPKDMSSASARTMAGRGTGWFYKIEGDDAYVITNHHVIDSAIGSDEVEIKVATGIDMWDYDVEVVGVDEVSDIAVLKIKKKDNEEWETLEIADYDDIGTGDSVVVVGHGMSMTFSATQGSIVYKERYGSRPYNLMLQVDAVVNQGNSGGPVINMDGKVVGVAQSILSPARQIPGWDGVGLAVGAKTTKRSIDYIMSPHYTSVGYVPYAEFPFNLGSVDYDVMKDIPKDQRYHAMVDYTNKGENDNPTIGELAGFEQGDIIMEINGERIGSSFAIIKMMIYAFPGDEWTVKYRRGEDILYKDIVLREMDREKLVGAVKGSNRGPR